MNDEEKVATLARILYVTWMNSFNEAEGFDEEIVDWLEHWENENALIDRERFFGQARSLIGLFRMPNQIMEVK